MRQVLRLSLASALVAFGGITTASSASASSVAIGSIPTGAIGPCGDGTTIVQDSVSLSEVSYAVPAGGGVITSWSIREDATSVPAVKLKLFRRQSANEFLVAGESAAVATTANATNVFLTRVSAQAGDLLALRVDGGTGSCTGPGAGSGTVVKASSLPDKAPGSVDTMLLAIPSTLLNLSAVVESDADADGYGDDTQDHCPTNGATHDACPAASAPTPSPADTVAPALSVVAASKQRVDRLLVSARVNEAATLIATGRLSISGKSKALALRRARRTAPAGRSTALRLKLPKRARRRAGRALRRGLPVKARITIEATDATGNSTSIVKTVRTTRKRSARAGA